MAHWTQPDHSFHLTYCLNIHPSYTLNEVRSSIRDYTLPLKERLYPDRRMGVGLRLSYETVEQLHKDDEKLKELKRLLDDHDLYVFTLNAFPAGQFQGTAVKENVFKPSWLKEDRVRYTRWAAETLIQLMDEDTYGSISTLPGTFREWGNEPRHKERILANLLRICFHLHRQEEQTEKRIQLCLEPEPLCTFQETDDLISFYQNYLMTDGIRQYTDALSLSEEDCRSLLQRHLGICLDTAHLAVLFEDPVDAIGNLRDNDVGIGKVQLSSAPVLFQPSERPNGVDQLLNMNEEQFLHQTAARDKTGELQMVKDLSGFDRDLLDTWLEYEEWRTHFHVPIFLEQFDHLYTTQEITRQVLDEVLDQELCSHVEIETYSLDCIPRNIKRSENLIDVVDVLEQEFSWVHNAVRELGYALPS